ncbi:MAG: MtrAB system response regulator MtrA [Propionibacteriaceae bacterium]|nr:MtrAB system response regulator MtrA [Propionibacteriaceae bacterium]
MAAGASNHPVVLVVDDDVALAEMLQIVLRQEGFETVWCGRGDRAVEAFRRHRPDVVLLDIMLPGGDGVEVCRTIRAESGVPIVMLTARSDTQDVVRGLEAGADDYVSKPFKVQELVARLRTRLRRLEADVPGAAIAINDVVINPATHKVTRDGQEVMLTPLEFDLLMALATHPRQVLTRQKLMEDVWGYHHSGDTKLINVHIQRLRSKIEKDPERPEIVITVRGVGYRVEDNAGN